MKKIIHKEVCEITLRTFRFLLMFIIITLNHNHVKAGGNINSTSGYLMLDSVYYNNVTEVWTINTGVNKPVKFDFWIDVENYADFVHIYAVDMFGNDFHVGSFTGSSCCNSISTNFPSGKAKIVFKTDELICGTDGYDGAWIHFYADNSYSGVVNENVFINNQSLVNGNSMVSGKLGVGTLQPSKRFEVWDGSSARFTFSANSSTSGYEVAHTLDNIGYKINVGSSIRNYKVSVNGIDKLKILSNENYGLGAFTLHNVSTGSYNLALGAYNLTSNTTGGYNVSLGTYSMYLNTTGSYNTATGHYALRNNTTGQYNSALGPLALYSISSGSFNIGIGFNAGRYIENGSTANSTSSGSIFIGRDTRAKANDQTNQIVIGDYAIGAGSNTVTIGNNNITSTILKGKVGIGNLLPHNNIEVVGSDSSTLDVAGFYNSFNYGNVKKAETRINIGKVESGWRQPMGAIGAFPFSNYDSSNGLLVFYTRKAQNLVERLRIDQNGRVGIGTTIIPSDYKLAVEGKIIAEEVMIKLRSNWPDFVFHNDYDLMPIADVESFVLKNSHLPGIPDAVTVSEEGVSIGEMQKLLLQKIEELTLYIIKQDKDIMQLKTELSALKPTN